MKLFFYVLHNLYWLRFQRLLAFPSVVLFYSKALLPGTSISKVKFCYFFTSFVALCVFDIFVCIRGEELCFVRYRDQERCLLACPSGTELEIKKKKQSALHLR